MNIFRIYSAINHSSFLFLVQFIISKADFRFSLLKLEDTSSPLPTGAKIETIFLSFFCTVIEREYFYLVFYFINFIFCFFIHLLSPLITHISLKSQIDWSFKIRSCEFAIELEEVLGTSAEIWIKRQAEFDLWLVKQKVL